jgi:steroid delta-isomerase-like uncharacterized protein
MSAEENKALVRRFFEEVFNKGNLALAGEVLAPNYVLHDPATPNLAGGPEGYKQMVSTYRNAFPDLQLTVEDQMTEGEKVVTRWTTRGTQQGALPDIPPTGKQTTVTGITISCISGSKITEDWQTWDALGMMQQLGVIPVPAPGQAGK